MFRILAASFCFAVAACAPSASPPSEELALPAQWTLDPDASRIAFASIKANQLIETHYFPELSGSIAETGDASVEIVLDAVETKIDIRNERMREMFFETSTFPTATVATTVDQSAFTGLAIGERRSTALVGQIDLHGQSIEVDVPTFVTRISADRISVESSEPVVLYVEDFDLGAGLEMLREIAMLPSITPASPVTFTFVFETGAGA